jgi:hypothetical protein
MHITYVIELSQVQVSSDINFTWHSMEYIIFILLSTVIWHTRFLKFNCGHYFGQKNVGYVT